MKNLTRFLSLAIAFVLFLNLPFAAFAAEVADATIDNSKPASLTIWTYDWTNAVKDGVWNENSFVSTGHRESYVEDVLGSTVRKGDDNDEKDNVLGNGQTSDGYAVKGAEFHYLKVGQIVTFTESGNDGHADYNMTQVLYGIHKVEGAKLLKAIGLENGARRYTNADNTDKLDGQNYYYYTSNTLNKALADALASNSTTVKDALETYIKKAGGAAMPLTDGNGKTMVRDLPLGLYLLVQTATNEATTSTVNPFFVSLPMTTVSGDKNSESPAGGHEWNYNVVIYPKNETGIPTLEKTVREAKADTGKNEASASITDGFAHNATASAGDTMEFQIISTLPTITSQATHLSHLKFYDFLDEGLSYNKAAKDVKVEIFTDKACTDKVATWAQNSGLFEVTYSSDDRNMTVEMTDAGLADINGDTENANGKLYVGYSNYTIRVTYTADVNSSNATVFGEDGNCNKVVLTWKRTSSTFFDTLNDDAHVYTFGIDLTKVFSHKEGAYLDNEDAQEAGMYKHVKFVVKNATDGYFVTAERSDEEGIYYVTGHAAEEADATIFYPVDSGDESGKIIIKGLEDDEYVLTEVETYDGYTLLKDDIHVVISAKEDKDRACSIYKEDVFGALQNDPRYSFDGGLDMKLNNIPQKQLAHNYLTASATVDGNNVTMLEDAGSENALAPLTVINTRGFDLPQTGEVGAWAFPIFGVIGMAACVFLFVFILLKKEKNEDHL